MAQQQINLGTSPSGQDGDDARTAFTKVNENFTEVYAGIGGAQPTNPKLTAIAASVWAANQLMYATGPDTVAMTSLTDFARSILDDADDAAVRATLGGTVVGQALFTATSEASARASLQLGTAATSTVTISNNDATAGRITKVGDFGLGGAAVVIPDATAAATVLDGNNVASGKYHLQLTGSTTWRGLPSGEYLVDVSRLGASGGCVQKATHYSTGAEYERRVTSQNFAKKVLIAGDYGLGSFAERLTPAVAEGLVLDSGFYEVQPQTAAQWPLSPFVNAWTRFLHIRHNNPSGYWTQLAMNFDTRTRMKVRGMSAGVIGDWAELYTQHSVLGTVSQSGGVPTGAIIERGFNSGGQFTKYADGTMIQWGRIELSASIVITTANSAGGYRSAQSQISFPTSFAVRSTPGDNPIVLDVYCNNNAYGVRAFAADDNSVVTGAIVYTTSGSAVTVPGGSLYVIWKAVGRWF